VTGRDHFESARAVADAVLYEGYVLYPYRASSCKNQVRWQFGVLVPRWFSESDGSERCFCRTECLARLTPESVLRVRIRFIQVQHRRVDIAVGVPGAPDRFEETARLVVGNEILVPWEEGLDRTVDVPALDLAGVDPVASEHAFGFDGSETFEPVASPDGTVVGRLVRKCEPIEGRILVEASVAGADVASISVTVENTTRGAVPSVDRGAVMDRSLVALHTMLGIDGGSFLSMFDPPVALADLAGQCHNEGTFPVLIGDDDVMLSSPIILYDHPEVAPESPGDLYDATEIDEILALRIMTLTDDEKAEARGTDSRAAALVDRCDHMPPEVWSRLHGAVRSIRPVEQELSEQVAPGETVPWWDPTVDSSVDPFSDSTIVAGVQIVKGDPVILRPSRRADAHDLFLVGMKATVAGVFNDVDGGQHVAVTIDDDPARDELVWQGRFLYFHPDELEPVRDQVGSK
jgi:hypothetical protein